MWLFRRLINHFLLGIIFFGVLFLFILRNGFTEKSQSSKRGTGSLRSEYTWKTSSSKPCDVMRNLTDKYPFQWTSDIFAKCFMELEKKYPDVSSGGRWSPQQCHSHERVAIIVPYRDREEHLRLFLDHIHAFLQHQLLSYVIVVVEQTLIHKFNRGLLMNIGFLETKRMYGDQFTCFIFHDVDLLPLNLQNLYACSDQPKHMSHAIDIYKFKLLYKENFGGVTALTDEQIEKVDGFPNNYFGWGAEDDEFYRRVKFYHYKPMRVPWEIGQYRMLHHHKETGNPKRIKTLSAWWSRIGTDGLKSASYRIPRITKYKLFTWILADPIMTTEGPKPKAYTAYVTI